MVRVHNLGNELFAFCVLQTYFKCFVEIRRRKGNLIATSTNLIKRKTPANGLWNVYECTTVSIAFSKILRNLCCATEDIWKSDLFECIWNMNVSLWCCIIDTPNIYFALRMKETNFIFSYFWSKNKGTVAMSMGYGALVVKAVCCVWLEYSEKQLNSRIFIFQL